MVVDEFLYGALGPEVIKLFSCSTQMSIKFIMLINVKMPTTVESMGPHMNINKGNILEIFIVTTPTLQASR